MKTIKKLTALILILGISVAFAGCGTEETGEDPGVPEAGQTIAFETTDLEGNSVSSDRLFSENRITMVNVWGTFCPPCIDEMPELAEMEKEYAEKGAGIVGVMADVPSADADTFKDAEDIVKQTGVEYTNLIPWESFEDDLAVSAVPTTFFVDSQGNIIGEPIVGAMVDEYKRVIDEYLEGAE